MSSNDALYTRLFDCLHAFQPDVHLRRISNWVWIVVGLIQSHPVYLSEMAQHIPSDAETAKGQDERIRISGFYDHIQGAGNKTVIPARASAKIDFRLVPDQNPDDLFAKLCAHLDRQGFSDGSYFA